jgi:hypothetical protein
MDMEEVIRFFTEEGIQWVMSQRDRSRAHGRELTTEEQSTFAPFFEPGILVKARVSSVSFIDNPGFYSELKEMGIGEAIDFRLAAGITFMDTIVIAIKHLEPHLAWVPLLFHELVHVVQYEILGVEEFVDRYVRGWAENGLDYYAIPLEQEAYRLQRRFTMEPEKGFSVVKEIGKHLDVYGGS